MLTYQEYVRKAYEYYAWHPEQRYGQSFVNYLWAVNRPLAVRAYAETDDPFYDDKNMPRFLDFLAENW